MTTATHAKLPTQAQINAQFTHGRINESLQKYLHIKNKQNNQYKMGNLTQQWYGPNSTWMNDINNKYTEAEQEQIVGYIVDFLIRPEGPRPFTINWSSGKPSITQTADTIEIVGYAAPPE
jgi:hypothetical protein